VPFFGLRYAGNYASFIDWSVYYFGSYSEAELELLGRVLSVIDHGCCLDVGANVGHHALFFAVHASSVIAVEPVAALAKEIHGRVAANGLHNVEVVQCGLGERAAKLPFFASTDHNQGTGTFVPGGHGREGQIIRVRAGDEVLAERGDPPVALVKIDVEGFEPHVLRGLQRTLERARPVVFLEWSAMSAERAGSTAANALFPAGYSLFHFEPGTVWLGLFSRAPFVLKPWLRGTRIDGHLLAVPAETLPTLRPILGLSAN
jgi:FkbM family methyltransferase